LTIVTPELKALENGMYDTFVTFLTVRL